MVEQLIEIVQVCSLLLPAEASDDEDDEEDDDEDDLLFPLSELLLFPEELPEEESEEDFPLPELPLSDPVSESLLPEESDPEDAVCPEPAVSLLPPD